MLAVARLVLSLVALALFAAIANAQVKSPPVEQESVAIYNGWVNGWNSPSALAVDGQGNVLVTGKSAVNGIGFDYATLKYDPTGNLLWEQRYVGLGNGSMWNLPSALAVDRRGDVLVTGKSLGVTNNDIVTLKYGPDGNLLWGQRYDSPERGDDEAYALVATKYRFALVAGRSLNKRGNYDYVILKYDPDGHLFWERRYDGSGNGDDEARALAVDGLGNVYVTGLSVGNGIGQDIVTLKYDPNGNLLWAQRYNDTGSGNDQARALAVDGLGNVYVTGQSWNGSSADYVTLKYDPNGNLLWARYYDGTGNGDNNPVALALHQVTVNNEIKVFVYVTGRSMGDDTNYGFATVKYDADGTLLWEKRYNTPGRDSDGATALAVDGQGNVYVTGTVQGRSANADYATLKYDTNGKLLWQVQYDGQANKQDSATALAVDGQGNVYVTGGSTVEGSGISEIVTVKYKQN